MHATARPPATPALRVQAAATPPGGRPRLRTPRRLTARRGSVSLLGLMGLLAGCGSFPESEPVRGTSATPAERVLTLVEDTQHPGARVGDDDLAGASAATVLEIGTLSVPGRIERAVLVVTPRRVAGEPFARLGALLVEEVELTWGSTPPVPGATRPLAVTDLGLRGVLEALPTTTGEWRIELDPALLGWYRVSLRLRFSAGGGPDGTQDLVELETEGSAQPRLELDFVYSDY